MSLTSGEMSPADIAAVTGNNNDGFGNGAWWLILLFLFGWGRGYGGIGGGGGQPCATQADVRSAVDQQTLISKIDQQTYGMADSFNSLNNTINGNFRTLDGAICNLGYQALQNTNAIQSQLAQCCCDTRSAIQENTTQGVMNTNSLSRQLSDCCCDLEKMNMQNRFDAQTYNCNTLQAIDKLGDRIIGYMNDQNTQNLRDELQSYRLAASQAKQNEYLIGTLRPMPVPSYPSCNPWAASYGFNNGGCCNNGCGSF